MCKKKGNLQHRNLTSELDSCQEDVNMEELGIKVGLE